MYKSMLVATDGSPTASQAVRVATELAGTLGATLHIADVYRTGEGAALSAPGMTHREGIDRGSMAATDVDAAASYARSKGIVSESHAITGDVAESIVKLAEQQHVDLIVVGNKGMRGIRRVLGSVPNAVAHSAPCSVLIVNTT